MTVEIVGAQDDGGRTPGARDEAEVQAGLNVLGFEVREVGQDLLRGDTVGKHFEDVGYPDAQPPDAGSSAALLRIRGDSCLESLLVHGDRPR